MSNQSLQKHYQNTYVFAYRIAPHCTTCCSPPELQTGRKLRSRLKNLLPCKTQNVNYKQFQQEQHYNGRRVEKKVKVRDKARDYSISQNHWNCN